MKPILLLFFCAGVLSFDNLKSLANTEPCTDANCKIEDGCRCSSANGPTPISDYPQLIMLTFDEAVREDLVNLQWSELFFDRTNPDGAPISGTFFVPHEFTDYSQVKALWARGFEIGVNSITKNNLAQYWQEANVSTLVAEFLGQREIIAKFAGIPIEDVKGARTPQLLIDGDNTFTAYHQSGILYDSSWPSRSDLMFFPYTLDYLSSQSCLSEASCPVSSFPGIWVLPIIDFIGNSSRECHSLYDCLMQGDTDFLTDWLVNSVENIRSVNKAPITLLIESSWFNFTNNSRDALIQFLDHMATLNDVFFVSQSQAIEYMKNPVKISDFHTTVYNRTNDCIPQTCQLSRDMGTWNQTYYMVSCEADCPQTYPWIYNPEGN